jgi:hypothetical protein
MILHWKSQTISKTTEPFRLPLSHLESYIFSDSSILLREHARGTPWPAAASPIERQVIISPFIMPVHNSNSPWFILQTTKWLINKCKKSIHKRRNLTLQYKIKIWLYILMCCSSNKKKESPTLAWRTQPWRVGLSLQLGMSRTPGAGCEQRIFLFLILFIQHFNNNCS